MLQQMYQAWCDGNERCMIDWSIFVYKAAQRFNTSADETMKELQKYNWFYWKHED